MGLFRRNKGEPPADVYGNPEGATRGINVGEPPGHIGIPMGVFPGFRGSSPHAVVESLPGAYSYQYDDSPITWARYSMGRGQHDVQLSNGWQRTNYGLRTVYASSAYLNEVQPEIPGQTRLIGMGGSPNNFVPKGPSPQNMQNIVAQAQSAPSNPGGPGQINGVLISRGAGG